MHQFQRCWILTQSRREWASYRRITPYSNDRYVQPLTKIQIGQAYLIGPHRGSSIKGTWPGVSLTKPCDASYDQLTRRRSHELILRTNCYIALGCVVRVFPCVALRNVMLHVRENRTYKLNVRTSLWKTPQIPVGNKFCLNFKIRSVFI